jgi:lipoate-protein ligase A
MGVDADFASEERPAVYQPACYLRALHPAHDVVGPDGRKVSGNAQYRQRDAVVQHGSLTFATSPDRHCGCFAGDPDPDDFAGRVGGIEEYADCSRAEAVETLRSALADWVRDRGGAIDREGWSETEHSRARARASEKFGSADWTRAGVDPTA